MIPKDVNRKRSQIRKLIALIVICIIVIPFGFESFRIRVLLFTGVRPATDNSTAINRFKYEAGAYNDSITQSITRAILRGGDYTLPADPRVLFRIVPDELVNHLVSDNTTVLTHAISAYGVGGGNFALYMDVDIYHNSNYTNPVSSFRIKLRTDQRRRTGDRALDIAMLGHGIRPWEAEIPDYILKQESGTVVVTLVEVVSIAVPYDPETPFRHHELVRDVRHYKLESMPAYNRKSNSN